jgi:outer membrane protein TolC
LTLSASGGYQSTSSSNLFDWPSRFWSVGPQLAQTIFDGGARRAATAQARALNDEAAATYRETVLTAFQSVEDNLAALRILSLELKQEHNAVVAAQRTVELSIIRYRNGVDSYVNVITAQNTFLTNRETELQVQLKQLTASVNLINNLGGGWSTASWGQTERLALHPPAPGSAADLPAAPGTPNPPAIPEELIRPDELLRQDQESVTPAVSPTDKRPR